MNIYLNNKSLQTKIPLSVQELLHEHQCDHIHFAVAVNNLFIPRSAYSTIFLQEGDHVDIIVPMQGG